MSFLKKSKPSANDDEITEVEPGFHRSFYLTLLTLLLTFYFYIIYVTDTFSVMMENQKKDDFDETKVSYVSVTTIIIWFSVFTFTILFLHTFLPYWFGDTNTPLQCVKLCAETYSLDPANLIEQTQRPLRGRYNW
tara:strand:+ start:10254 stop:10658 length:405 start_codon:yes stop_codon:yes gene_type:complete